MRFGTSTAISAPTTSRAMLELCLLRDGLRASALAFEGPLRQGLLNLTWQEILGNCIAKDSKALKCLCCSALSASPRRFHPARLQLVAIADNEANRLCKKFAAVLLLRTFV